MKKFRKILPMLLLATLAILFQSAHTGGARAAGKWLTLPRGMRTIEACAFENCLDATGVIIPKGVTAIGANAFRGCENLAEAYIPDSVTAIGAGAFCGCDALVSLVLPDGLTQISDACFMRCENLCSLVIPTGVTRIGAGAFEFAGLAELTLPSTVTEIGERAFYFCTDLTRVTIPSGVKKIGADAFHADDSVTILGVEGSYAQRYAQDNGLPFQTASVRISAQPADATIAAGDTAAFVVRALGIGLTYQWEENRGDGWKTCALAGSGTAVLRVPYAQAVDQTQYRCTVTDASKKRATSTAAVLRVAPIVIRVQPEDAIACEGEDAYFTLIADGSGLSYRWQTDAGSGWTDCAPQDGRANQLCVHSDTPGGSRFRCLLRDAYGNTLASDAACLWAASGGLSYTAYPDTAVITGYTGRRTDVVIPPTIKGLKVVAIQPEAFRGRTDISSVVIPGTVSALESGSFSNCTGLKRVVISNGTKWLWDGVFRGCSALESVSIPPSVAHIDDYAFMGCGKLREVKLPAALTSLSERVFAGCESLESIWVPDNVSSIGEGAFVNCVNAATIRLPDGLVEIGQEAFSGCQSVTRLTIPQGVTQIRDWTFDNCLRLKSIVIPSGVVSIGDYAFSQCRALAGIELPKALRSLGAFAFYGDSALARIELPGGIQSVKRNCFGYCGRLETALIGSGIGSIESCAFESCGALKAVVVPGSVVSISDDAFDSGEPTFYGEADSYAQSYAARKGLPFSQATTGILAQPRSVTALCGETVEMRVTAFGRGSATVGSSIRTAHGRNAA